jgi:hypothetical protein
VQNTLCWDGPKTVVSQILRSIHSDFVSTFSPASIQITMIDFKGSQYPKGIIILYAVLFYVRYAVSYRQSRSDTHSIWDDITCELKAR